MRPKIHPTPRLASAAALLALVGTLSGAMPGPASPDAFDVYAKGIRIGELTVDSGATGRTFTIRTLDAAANRWLPPATVAEAEAPDHPALQLPGALRRVAASLPAIERVDWSAVVTAGLDSVTTYILDREVAAEVDGRRTEASYWAARDASRPLDLIIARDNRLLAAIDVSQDFVLVRRGYEGFTTVARWTGAGISPARYGYRLHERALVPAPDGVRLTTLVYLPTGDAAGPFPTIFVRTPYGITDLIGGYWHYVARGYAVVLQAARGTAYWDAANRSEGRWQPMINEPADGAAALEWIAAQPWSDGQICMQGGSYVAYTQWTASMAANPALRCIVPESSMGTAFSDQPFWGGTLVEGMAYYVLWMLDKPILPGRTWNEILHHRPLVDLDRFATGEEIPQWNELLAHQTNDAYWQRQNWYRSTAPRRMASLQISGWFDDDFPGTESNWALMQRHGVGPQRLIVGPWKHGYNTDRALNGYAFGAAAIRDDIWLLKQQWYDHVLRGMANGVERTRVEYFVLGANRWREASAWPPAEAAPARWYLGSDGHAARLTTRGRLSPDSTRGGTSPDRFIYDPANPPPNWYSFDQMQRWQDVQTFPYDVKDLESRPDVAVYTSEPLERDLTIAGDVRVVLFASTDLRDTDWWVHLADVDTTGRSNRLTIGVIRARFRNGDDPQHHAFGSNYEREELLSGDPAAVVRYEFGLRSIANTFRKGHRIRVAVMNAMDNYSFPNTGTGGNEAEATTMRAGRMALHHAPGRASYILLPVMPD